MAMVKVSGWHTMKASGLRWGPNECSTCGAKGAFRTKGGTFVEADEKYRGPCEYECDDAAETQD